MKQAKQYVLFASLLALAAHACGNRETAEPDQPAASSSPGVAPESPEPSEKPAALPDERTVFSIFAAGDVFLGARLAKYLKIKKLGLEHPFSRLREDIEKHDIAFANLESAISTRGRHIWKKKYLFRMTPQQAEGLKHSGLDVVSIANNHTTDFGEKALQDTIDALDAMSIAHVGAGKDIRAAAHPALITIGRVNVVFLAYNAFSSPLTDATEDSAGSAPMVLDRVVEDIRKQKTPGSVVVVSAHWGVQHTQVPVKRQVRMARAMIDAGADVIVGHHSHCPQSIEVYKGKPIFYSLGNFVFGYLNPDMKQNLAAVVRFEGTGISAAEIFPVHGFPLINKHSPFLLKDEQAGEAVAQIVKISKKFGTKIDFSGDRGIIKLK
ncbi:MAG: CapA family protein [Pseudomonadota bacterium]